MYTDPLVWLTQVYRLRICHHRQTAWNQRKHCIPSRNNQVVQLIAKNVNIWILNIISPTGCLFAPQNTGKRLWCVTQYSTDALDCSRLVHGEWFSLTLRCAEYIKPVSIEQRAAVPIRWASLVSMNSTVCSMQVFVWYKCAIYASPVQNVLFPTYIILKMLMCLWIKFLHPYWSAAVQNNH